MDELRALGAAAMGNPTQEFQEKRLVSVSITGPTATFKLGRLEEELTIGDIKRRALQTDSEFPLQQLVVKDDRRSKVKALTDEETVKQALSYSASTNTLQLTVWIGKSASSPSTLASDSA